MMRDKNTILTKDNKSWRVRHTRTVHVVHFDGSKLKMGSYHMMPTLCIKYQVSLQAVQAVCSANIAIHPGPHRRLMPPCHRL